MLALDLKISDFKELLLPPNGYSKHLRVTSPKISLSKIIYSVVPQSMLNPRRVSPFVTWWLANLLFQFKGPGSLDPFGRPRRLSEVSLITLVLITNIPFMGSTLFGGTLPILISLLLLPKVALREPGTLRGLNVLWILWNRILL